MDHFCTFDVSKIIPKNMHYFPYVTFKPILAYIRRYDHQTRVHWDVCKRPNSLEFSLMWIWVTCLLAFHMPRYCSYLTLHYPFGVLYEEPLGYIEGEELKSKETIVHYFHSLHILEFASLCPYGALCFLPKLTFYCELVIERWRIEVVEAQVEESVSSVRRRANKGCHSV